MPLFADFPPVSKEAWLAKVTAELKGRQPAQLDWQITPQLAQSPFQHRSDQIGSPAVMPAGRKDNSWAIGEYIPVQSGAAAARSANQLALAGLVGGSNAPLFQLTESVDLATLLADIDPAYVQLHFVLPQGVAESAFAQSLAAVVAGYSPQGGTIHFSDASDPATSGAIQQLLPDWRIQAIDGRPHFAEDDPVTELTTTLQTALEALDQGTDAGLSAQAINDQLHFHWSIGTSYPLNIAKLRAARLVWANVLAAYGLPDASMPPFIAHCRSVSSADEHTRMIHAATQALTAAVGGASCIYVPPASASTATDFTRRIARNVQHLLQLEAGVDRVADPAAGSYYLEALTDRIATAVWARIKQ